MEEIVQLVELGKFAGPELLHAGLRKTDEHLRRLPRRHELDLQLRNTVGIRRPDIGQIVLYRLVERLGGGQLARQPQSPQLRLGIFASEFDRLVDLRACGDGRVGRVAGHRHGGYQDRQYNEHEKPVTMGVHFFPLGRLLEL